MFRRIINIVSLVGLVSSLCVLICCSSLSGNSMRRWRVLSVGPGGHSSAFNSLIFFDELNGLGLTALGLASTTDGGTNWELRLSNNGNRGFYNMRFADRQKGWIVGAENKAVGADRETTSKSHKPLILKTEDGGATWREIGVDLGPKGAKFTAFLNICSDRSGTVWIVGDAGLVEATIESDALQISEVTITNAALKDVSCSDSGEAWAVGDDGLIMHYQQNKWSSIQYHEAKAFFNKVRIVGSDIWLVGGIPRGQGDVQGLLISSHNGDDWENRTPPKAVLLFDLELSKNEGWLVGAQGNIYHSDNGGATWQKEISPTENDLFAIFFLNAKRGWIGGDKLTMLGQDTK